MSVRGQIPSYNDECSAGRQIIAFEAWTAYYEKRLDGRPMQGACNKGRARKTVLEGDDGALSESRSPLTRADACAEAGNRMARAEAKETNKRCSSKEIVYLLTLQEKRSFLPSLL